MTDSDETPGVLERTVENLVTVLAGVLPSMSARRIHGGTLDGLIAFAIYLAVALSAHVGMSYWAVLDTQAAIEVIGTVAAGLALAAAVLLVLRQAEALAGLVVGILWAMTLGTALAVAAYLAADVRTFGEWVLFGVLPVFLPVAVLLLARLGPLRGVLVTLAVAVPTFAGVLEEAWLSRSVGADGEAATPVLPDTEMIYALQRDLLEAEAQFRPGDPARTEMFAVLGAGYAYQGVFAREVQAVAAFLEREMGADGRVVRLINDDAAPTEYPLMNRVNLRRALARAGEAMDDDDLLLLFLTSHGGPGALSTRFQSVISRDVHPADIAAALDDAGIGNAIVVISACYSGSFTEALAAPNRLILTAARADRTSFGCSDTAEWTEWGRAFFVDAWPETRDPRLAAEAAREIVKQRETERGLEASEPQIVEGAEIGPVIDRWLAEIE